MENIENSKEKNLAYIVGVMIGDGGIYGKSYVVFARDKNKDFCEYISKLVENTTKYKPKIVRVGGAWRTHLNNKEALNYFLQLGVQKGRKLTTLTIPEWIRDKDLKIAFLQGIYDAEGYVTIDKQTHNKKVYEYPLVGIDMIGKKIVTQIANFLSELSIRATVQQCALHGFGKRIQWRVTTKGWDEVKKFSSIVGFRHPERKEKLTKMVGLLRGHTPDIR